MDTEVKYKKCIKCGVIKLISEFNRQTQNKDGLGSYCKSCAKEYDKNWRKANPEKVKEYSKKWKNANPKKAKKSVKNWRKANPEKVKESVENWQKANSEEVKKNVKNWQKANPEYQKNWREANPKKVKERTKKWQKVNPEKIKESHKKWREANPEYDNQYRQNRRAIDPSFKLKCNVRNSIRTSLRKQGYTKNSKTYEILGIKYKKFYEWLNNKASNGLNLNTDDIQLDHVVPVSLAQTEKEILVLNHYSNYQLLSSKNNFSKNNTYIFKINLNRVLTYHPNPEILQSIIDRSDVKIK